MSSPPQTELSEIRAGLGRLLHREIADIERIGGGFNSQVYRVHAGGERFALKVYFRHPNDKRDRLATEFGSFTHLWSHGVREIPQPLQSDPERGWAVYQFVEGEKIPRGQVDEQGIHAAAVFLGRLRELSRKADSGRLEAASEAFFSVKEVVENVRRRFSRLGSVDDLSGFLNEEFEPLLQEVVRWSQGQLGLEYDRELAPAERTLSPSDFGFHNALRQPDGRIIFLDFEYFGWDDPAKMISDFLLHPAMELSAGYRKQFTSAVLRFFSDCPGLAARLRSVYPLFGLKWCAIILNEFLPEQMARRQFAAGATDIAALQARQLAKARAMLQRIRSEYQNFPYHD